MKKSSLLFICLLLVFSCSDKNVDEISNCDCIEQSTKPVIYENENETDPMIDGPCPDNIDISKTELIFSSKGGSEVIMVCDNFWWINTDMILNGNEYVGENYGLRVEQNASGNIPKKVEGDWFLITMISDCQLKVEVKKNKKDKERTLTFKVQSGNCLEDIHVIQN